MRVELLVKTVSNALDGSLHIWMMLQFVWYATTMLTPPSFLSPLGKLGPGYDPYQEIHHKPPAFPPSIRRRCPSLITTPDLQSRTVRKARRDLQGRQGTHRSFRIQDTLWWWPEHRLRVDL
jgi:hypothetical protein